MSLHCAGCGMGLAAGTMESPCPQCGSKDRVIGDSDSAVGVEMGVGVATKVHLWWTWLRIAARHVGMAKRAREHGVTPSSFEAPESAALSAEFEASLVAIAAVAFAMEALDLELKGSGHELDGSLFERSREGLNRGFFVAQRLIQVFRLEGSFAEELPTRLQQVFSLRNQSVHFESVTREGTRPHPSGTSTAAELTVFVEASRDALWLGRKVIDECRRSVEAGRHDVSATAVARELPGVLGMLDEVMTSAGLR